MWGRTYNEQDMEPETAVKFILAFLSVLTIVFSLYHCETNREYLEKEIPEIKYKYKINEKYLNKNNRNTKTFKLVDSTLKNYNMTEEGFWGIYDSANVGDIILKKQGLNELILIRNNNDSLYFKYFEGNNQYLREKTGRLIPNYW